MSRHRVHKYVSDTTARAHATGDEIVEVPLHNPLPRHDRRPVDDSLPTPGGEAAEPLAWERVTDADPEHVVEVATYSATAGSARWLASCSCGWLSSTTRHEHQRALDDCRAHLREVEDLQRS